MDIGRMFRHLCATRFNVRRRFPAAALRAIGEAIGQGELRHTGEIRFAVEGSLDLVALLRGMTARQRAEEVFSRLRVWDTAQNNGVLIYLLLADRMVEIVADRGVHERVGAGGWQDVCRRMEGMFGEGRFEEGVLDGVRAVSEILAREYPAAGPNPNELPDAPVVLS